MKALLLLFITIKILQTDYYHKAAKNYYNTIQFIKPKINDDRVKYPSLVKT